MVRAHQPEHFPGCNANQVSIARTWMFQMFMSVTMLVWPVGVGVRGPIVVRVCMRCRSSRGARETVDELDSVRHVAVVTA